MRPAIVLDEADSLRVARLASTVLLVLRRLLSGSTGLGAGTRWPPSGADRDRMWDGTAGQASLACCSARGTEAVP